MNNRIEFSKETKNILAGRAGYQCSHPQCDMITIGPGDGDDKLSNIGEAAHIYSAAKNGPRGQNGLTEENLKSVNNGMWLCKNHARLIDTNSGEGFTASQLISWKQLHEEAIKRKQGRIHRNLGWISKIRITRSPIFVDDSIINLGKVTLLESRRNSVGKTAICEWLAVVSSEYYPQRWIPSSEKDLKFTIEVLVPEPHMINVSIDGNNNYKMDIDGVDSPFCGIPFRSFFFDGDVLKVKGREGLRESEYLCKALNVNIYTLEKLFSKMGFSEYSKFSKVALASDELNDVECTLKRRDYSVSLNSLSGGEFDSLLFELLVAKMQSYAEYTPLIFFIEASETSFDESRIAHYINFLASSEISFQTVVTSISSHPSAQKLGITHFFLDGEEGHVEITQV